MDALLLTLIACMAGEMGGKCQLLAFALGIRYRAAHFLLVGLALAGIANAALAATAAALIAPIMGNNARHLFMALAFIAGGIALALPARAPDTLSGWKTGPLLTGAAGLFILGLGEGSSFLIAGIATGRGNPALAAAGGAIGTLLAWVPAVLIGPSFFARVPVRGVRRAGAPVFLVAGFWIAVRALGLT